MSFAVPAAPKRPSKSPQDDEKAEKQEKQEKPPPNAPAPPVLKYEKPAWGDVASFAYSLEVLKGGVSIDKIKGPLKDVVTFGRLPLCDIVMEHPSLSRYHALLQFNGDGDAFLYDLESGYGTKVNKKAIPPRTHVRLQTGDQIRFGESTRLYIFHTDKPADDDDLEEDENYLLRHRTREADVQHAAEEETDTGATWGFPEDAVEEEDDETPVSGDAQLLSLEAEQMAVADAKRRRQDLEMMFGDDDEDLYDKTDTKRRKALKKEEKAETHEDLVKRQAQVEKQVAALQQEIARKKADESKQKKAADQTEDLDAYMDQLNKSAGASTGPSLYQLEKQLSDLQKEHMRVVKLVKLTKPLI
ncbi:SMAD/FHA domain-containing protein [Gongronella butleri]|nr:SMAD/FHA domain-containing protein [Gongronella butleri]